MYKTFEFMAVIDEAAGKFFSTVAIDRNDIIAQLDEIYGNEAKIEIYLLKQVH